MSYEERKPIIYYKNYGNTARAVEPAPPFRQKPQETVKTKKQSAVMFVYRNDHRHKFSVLTIITLMLIFAGAAGTAASFANVSVEKQQINALKRELHEKKLLIKNLSEEANRSADIGFIMDVARGKLGMSEPKPYQIIHINVPDENYVEYNYSTK